MATPHDNDNDSDNDNKNDNNINTYNSIALHIANECVHVHNERDFSQAKLDKEINARFLSNEHSDLYIFIS